MRIFAARVRGDNTTLAVVRMSDVQLLTRPGGVSASPRPTRKGYIDKVLGPFIDKNLFCIGHADGTRAYSNADTAGRLSPTNKLRITLTPHTPKLNPKTGRCERAFTLLVKVPAKGEPRQPRQRKRPAAAKATARPRMAMKTNPTGAKPASILTWGGTQFLGGGFKHMRAAWPATMRYTKASERKVLVRWIRLWQWRTWHSGDDVMVSFGQLMRIKRSNWLEFFFF